MPLLLTILPWFHWVKSVTLVPWGFSPQRKMSFARCVSGRPVTSPHVPVPDTLTHGNASAPEVPSGQLAYQGWVEDAREKQGIRKYP